MLKDEKHKSNRVECLICKKKGTPNIFCWICLNKWNFPKDTMCGNIDCGTLNVNIMLKEAPTKNISSIANVPIYRACIKCHTPIEHKSACKHMVCGNP